MPNKALSAAAPGVGDYDVLKLKQGQYGPWPPLRRGDGKQMMSQKQHDIAHALWVLVTEFDGHLHNASGQATQQLAQVMRRHDAVSDISVRTSLYDAVGLGLLAVEGHPKRTYDLRLLCEPAELPFPVPAWLSPQAPPVPDSAARYEVALAAAETREHEPAAPVVAPAEVAASTETGLDYGALAVSLLNEVVRRATTKPDDPSVADAPSYVHAERNHYHEQYERQRARVRVLERELETLTGVSKALRVDLAEERRLRAQLEENLTTTLHAARSYQDRLGDLLDEDAKRMIETMMRTAPGFDTRTAQRNGGGNRNGHITAAAV